MYSYFKFFFCLLGIVTLASSLIPNFISVSSPEYTRAVDIAVLRLNNVWVSKNLKPYSNSVRLACILTSGVGAPITTAISLLLPLFAELARQ